LPDELQSKGDCERREGGGKKRGRKRYLISSYGGGGGGRKKKKDRGRLAIWVSERPEQEKDGERRGVICDVTSPQI